MTTPDNFQALGPVTVANLTAAAGVTVTEDGWWPCLNITWRTPVPPTVTRLVAQVRERGSEGADVAETVVTPGDGLAKIVNGVSVGEHLEIRLVPSGAPGKRYQATPWIEVTTPWDALMQELPDGVSLGCFTIVCGIGEPTRTDLPIGSLYVREDIAQLWQYDTGAGGEEPTAVHIAIDCSTTMAGSKLATVKTASIAILEALQAKIAAGAVYYLDLFAYDGGFSSPRQSFMDELDVAVPVTVEDIDTAIAWVEARTAVLGGNDYSDMVISTYNWFEHSVPNAVSEDRCYHFVMGDGQTTFGAGIDSYYGYIPHVQRYAIRVGDDAGVLESIDNTPAGPSQIDIDDSDGLADVVLDALGIRIPGWKRFSVLTSIRLNGVEIEDMPISLDFIGENIEVETNRAGNVTVTVGGGAAGGIYMPLVIGTEPPTLVANGDGRLIPVAYN
jgi:hypothetical protein